VAETHEITGLIAFLCMPTSSFMTGQIVCIDGGLTAHGSTPNSFLGAWKSLVLILMLPQEGLDEELCFPNLLALCVLIDSLNF